jgi:beta-mannosidase
MAQLTRLFDEPHSLEDLIYLSQLTQAESVGYRVEHLRRNRGRCMGALYWQLNDVWPVTSWASIDYFGRFKALQYAAKRFFSPLLISCEDTGEMQIESGLGGKLGARLCVTNDTLESVSGEVVWQICDAYSRVIKAGREAVCVDPLSAKWLEKLDLGGVAAREHHLSYRFESGGAVLSEGHCLLAAPKNCALVDPCLEYRCEGDEIVISARAFARAVQVYSEDGDLLLDDNFFDMEAGEKRVKILSGSGKNIRVRSYYDVKFAK